MTILHSGILKTNEKKYTVKQLSIAQQSEILTLQDIVFEHLENKETLEKLSEAEYRNILGGNGFMIGAFVDGKLIAIRALLIPPIDEHHLGFAVGLREEELHQVIYQEISLVHPDFRGNRLQQQLADLIMKELEKSEHDFRYVCCTVAPFNIPSLKDKFNQQMEVKALDRIYGGKLRYVFMKDLEVKERLGWIERRNVPIDEIVSQQALLSSDWTGYMFVEEDDSQYCIRFGKSSVIR